MSMIFGLRKVDDEQLCALLQKPDTIIEFLYGPETAVPRSRFSLFNWFKTWRTPPEAIPEQNHHAYAPPPGEQIDIDKAWHGLHYLLTGTAWDGDGPQSFIINGGREIGDVDVGYGPARAFRPEEVKELHHTLKNISLGDLRARYNAKKMSELDIYPDIWEYTARPEHDNSEAMLYLLEHFNAMRKFIGRTAEECKGLVVFLF